MKGKSGKAFSLKRIAIFAHFDKDNKVDDYVVYYLQQLKVVCDNIIFVSTSDLPEDAVSKVALLCAQVIKRDNLGYDFVSWQIGINSIKDITQYDEIVICNDSVYGPFYPLADVFNAMREKNDDFWGITENHEIKYHIQSYFMVFRKNVFASTAFKDFWNSIEINQTKDELIEKYEVGLTQTLIQSKFKLGAYIKYSPSAFEFLKHRVASVFRKSLSEILDRIFSKRTKLLDSRRLNTTHYFWKDIIIQHKMPFIKIELLRDNPLRIEIKEYEKVISTHSDYDIELIFRHLKRVGKKGSQFTA